MTCPICYEDYDNEIRIALTLICGHTFCKKCTKKMYKQSKISCPLDKKSYYYDSMSVIVRNYTIQAILDADKAKAEEQEGYKYCAKHRDQRVKLFCKKDSVLICQECLIEEHLGH